MKKKIIFAILFVTTSMLLVGCEKDDVEDFMTDDNEVYVAFQAYEEGTLKITYENEDGTTNLEETGAIGWPIEPGWKVSEILNDWNITSIEAICQNDTFEGWLVYKEKITTDEDGFTEYTTELISGDKIYTTEEVLDTIVSDYDMRFIAKCQNVSIEEYNY